jgi:hypothetical protein
VRLRARGYSYAEVEIKDHLLKERPPVKKMIPVYVLQAAMLIAVLVVSHRMLNEVRSLRGEIMKVQSVSNQRPSRSEPALNVRVVNPVTVTQY